MEANNAKPCLSRGVAYTMFFRHLEAQAMKGDKVPAGEHLVRAMAISKDFATIARSRLWGSELVLEKALIGDWFGQFLSAEDVWMTQQEALLVFELAKPKLNQLTVEPGKIEPPINDRLINHFVGIPNLRIGGFSVDPSGLATLRQMAPYLVNLQCSLEYMKCALPPMKLDLYEVLLFSDVDEVDMKPIVSDGYQIRRIRLRFLAQNGQIRIMCSDRTINPFVEELILDDEGDRPRDYSLDVLEQLPNIRRVVYYAKAINWGVRYLAEIWAFYERANEYLQRSSNVHFVLGVQVADPSYQDHSIILDQLRRFGLLAEHEPSFVPMKELINDPDIKSCPCYEDAWILAFTHSKIKFVFWHN